MLPRLSITVGVMLRYELHDTLLFKPPQVATYFCLAAQASMRCSSTASGMAPSSNNSS